MRRKLNRASSLSLLLCTAALVVLAACAPAASPPPTATQVPEPTAASQPTAVPTAAVTPTVVDLNAEPTAAELAAAEAELDTFQVSSSSALGKSIEQLATAADLVVVAKVTSLGPVFNGYWASADPKAPPASDEYCIAQSYTLTVEQTLKGDVGQTINFSQTEGYLPGGMAPTAARVKAAKEKDDTAPLQVGDRYLFFLYDPTVVPELHNLQSYPPAMYKPNRFLLSADGSAIADGAKGPGLERAFPKGLAKDLVARVVKAIANGSK